MDRLDQKYLQWTKPVHGPGIAVLPFVEWVPVFPVLAARDPEQALANDPCQDADCEGLNLGAPSTSSAETNSAVQISRRALVRGFSFQCKHAPVRIADPFIMIAHVIGSLCIIHDLHNGQITRTLNNDCATRDKLCGQVRTCWRVRTRRLMPLPQVSRLFGVQTMFR
jgi:hypothetical protein